MLKVSVIIPVYNAGKYLNRTLNSILKQTYKDYEIICINDVSKDNSSDILEVFAQKDERIKVLNNKKNLGAALTRNVGIDMAKGDYIYFLDADDYIDEKYLECMVQKIEHENCNIVLNMSIQSESNGNISQFHHPSMPTIKPNGEYMDNIRTTHDAPCFIWARIYRKSFLNEYNLRFLNIHATDDVVFNAIVNMYTDKTFVFYGEKYHYTVNNNSVTGVAKSVDDRDLQHIKAHSMIYDYLKKHNKLDKNLKLFRVYPFMKVDTEEKFIFYKNFFEKIKTNFNENESIYNDMEKFFAYSLLNTSTYEEYLANYNKVVTIGFLRQGKNSVSNVAGSEKEYQ